MEKGHATSWNLLEVMNSNTSGDEGTLMNANSLVQTVLFSNTFMMLLREF
jgi:hypothetical protein